VTWLFWSIARHSHPRAPPAPIVHVRASCWAAEIPAVTPRCGGGSRMMPVPKYIAKTGTIHRNKIKAASGTAAIHAPINAWSWAWSRCNLLGIYFSAPSPNRGLRRVHWSKETSSLEFAFPNWSIGIKLICHLKHWIITMVETIIR